MKLEGLSAKGIKKVAKTLKVHSLVDTKFEEKVQGFREHMIEAMRQPNWLLETSESMEHLRDALEEFRQIAEHELTQIDIAEGEYKRHKEIPEDFTGGDYP